MNKSMMSASVPLLNLMMCKIRSSKTGWTNKLLNYRLNCRTGRLSLTAQGMKICDARVVSSAIREGARLLTRDRTILNTTRLGQRY